VVHGSKLQVVARDDFGDRAFKPIGSHAIEQLQQT
jgi:hypothetical protein